jgi:hypothetical protein
MSENEAFLIPSNILTKFFKYLPLRSLNKAYQFKSFLYLINKICRLIKAIIKHKLSWPSLLAGIGKLNKKFFTLVSTTAIIGRPSRAASLAII